MIEIKCRQLTNFKDVSVVVNGNTTTDLGLQSGDEANKLAYQLLEGAYDLIDDEDLKEPLRDIIQKMERHA